MALKPMILLCSVSLLMGGCAHGVQGPGRYASLPRGERASEVADVVIPGTVTARWSRQQGRGTDPITVLQHSVGTKADHKNLRVGTRTERSLSGGPEPIRTASIPALGAGDVRSPGERYDREANMNRLVKGGEAAAKPICSGC